MHVQVLLQQVRELQGQLQEAREQQSTHEAESQVCRAAPRFAMVLRLLSHALGASRTYMPQLLHPARLQGCIPYKGLLMEQNMMPASAGVLPCRCNNSSQAARLLHPTIPPCPQNSLSASAKAGETTFISTIHSVMQVLLQRLAGQAERTQQLEGQAQQAEAVQSELQTGLEMTGARLCLVLAAWMCTVAAKHKVGSCSAMCSAPLAA